jgi:hypothetical protein
VLVNDSYTPPGSSFTELYNWVSAFHHVPDTVWAAIIAALIAFATTIFSNRNSRKQLQMQLDYTASQQDRDRMMSLRRDVYLPATESATHCQGLLGQLLDINANAAEIGKQSSTDFATMAKVHLVGSEPTVQALVRFQQKLMRAYVEIIRGRLPMEIRVHAIRAHQLIMDKASAEQDKFLQLMKQLNVSGSNDAAAMERLRVQYENETGLLNQAFAKKKSLERTQLAEQLALAARHSTLNLEISQSMPTLF